MNRRYPKSTTATKDGRIVTMMLSMLMLVLDMRISVHNIVEEERKKKRLTEKQHQ